MRWIFAILLALLLSAHAWALGLSGSGAAANPITARAALASPLAEDQTAVVIIEVKIRTGWHIQSAAADDYIPTHLRAKPVAGLIWHNAIFPIETFVPAPQGTPGPQTIPVYEGTIYVEIPITQTGPIAGDAVLNLELIAQACDATSCLPPKTITLAVPLKVSDESAALLAGSRTQGKSPRIFEIESIKPAAGTSATTQATQTAPANSGPALMTDEQQLAAIAERPYRPSNQADLTYPLWALVLLALAGGAILNVMPCVLPVIPLKVLSLVQQAHGQRQAAVMHSLAFSAGVVALFVALAIVLKTFGWFYGQQFQSTGFLVAMVLFVVALALSMLGVWTIQVPQAVYAAEGALQNASARGEGGSYLGAFSNGLMATLLATPCSAPFLGGVLAWALTRSTPVAIFFLGLVGVGMSAPYLLLAAFPQWLNRLPRTGRWTELLKQGLGIVMLGVAVYLVQLIPNAQLWPWVLLGAVLVALVCWAWGQIPTFNDSAEKTWGIRLTALVLGTSVGWGMVSYARQIPPVMTTPSAEGNWQPFNVALLDDALAHGRPVVVDWTAAWCINCRALDATILSADSVQAAFKDHDVLLLRADLTSENEPATALNRKLGGEAIPVLAIFSPASPHEPVVMRDSYTRDGVIERVSRAK